MEQVTIKLSKEELETLFDGLQLKTSYWNQALAEGKVSKESARKELAKAKALWNKLNQA